jgi:hypothetical protein
MPTADLKLQKWEQVEVNRSIAEAERRREEQLLIDPQIIERYLAPPADTVFPLEYSYYLLGNAVKKNSFGLWLRCR